ncbi:hypothetical protein PE067_14495 [Paracoccus sp. DMF-8]|uniref:hypothetical protein n=1 Tax=Paracoccus sp. DMF-8 TaxID=3019445 RepID=UPI0023E3D89A|nr:hypothetical protein [Paracoccus sp. DMF-8]MDF3607228.1 hypothetical protein [Paracoccus sp. DMF-8]
MVLPTEVWITESERGSVTRFVAMPGLSRSGAKALERLLFPLIRRSAVQAFLPPPQP